MARAMSSFPVPLSPCNKTVLSVCATRAIALYTCTMRGLLPTRLPNGEASSGCRSEAVGLSEGGEVCSSARLATHRTSSTINGLVK